MKRYTSHAAVCVFGLFAGAGIHVVNRQEEEFKQNAVASRFVLSENAKPKNFDWQQPLIHPTYPPKLVQGETEFILK